MTEPIKFICVNIEQHLHLKEVHNFLNEQQADIVCFQEVREGDLPPFEQAFGYTSVFAPMHDILASGGNRKGVAILTRGEVVNSERIFYGDFMPTPPHNPTPDVIVPDQAVLLYAEVRCGEQVYSVATTHFTWSSMAQVTDYQRRNMTRLLANLSRYPKLILCGDFNTPRGDEIYDTLAHHYHDNLPKSVTTTVDGTFHRNGNLQLVVDSIFTTPHYRVSDVQVMTGVSDHCALVALVSESDR